MRRIVIDTNVFISSVFGGIPRRVIDFWISGRVTACFSKEILEEYLEVAGRMGLRPGKELDELLRLFRAGRNCLFSSNLPSVHVASDPDDDIFIQTAIALDADVIVTGDKPLQSLKEYLGIRIMNPRAFCEEIKAHGY